jgi:hypothetical protein
MRGPASCDLAKFAELVDRGLDRVIACEEGAGDRAVGKLAGFPGGQRAFDDEGRLLI